MKTLTAKLKDVPMAAIQIDDAFAKGDWLVATAIIEDAKRSMLHKLKTSMHEKIATLSFDISVSQENRLTR